MNCIYLDGLPDFDGTEGDDDCFRRSKSGGEGSDLVEIRTSYLPVCVQAVFDIANALDISISRVVQPCRGIPTLISAVASIRRASYSSAMSAAGSYANDPSVRCTWFANQP